LPPETARERNDGDDEEGDDGDHRRLENPTEQLLGVDAPVGVRQESPTHRVREQHGATEDGKDDGRAAHDHRVETGTAGDAAADAGEPAVVATVDPRRTDPVEEAVELGAARPAAGARRAGRSVWCIGHDFSVRPAGIRGHQVPP
jgi:hypothetical protein